MLVDSHCHLHLIDYEKLGISYEDVISKAKDAGIERMLCVATKPHHLEEMSSLTYGLTGYVDLSIGLHPTEQADNYASLIEQGSKDPRVVAIGETGLDYYWDDVPKAQQKEHFETQIGIAIAANKPLIIHTRDAKEDTVAMLKSNGADKVGGVMHCFTEDWEMAKKCLDLGFYISFSGIVTFNKADQIKDVASKAPLDRILVETDCPYLAPVPVRGKINHPAYVEHTAKFLAMLKGLGFEELAAATTQNYHDLFLTNK